MDRRESETGGGCFRSPLIAWQLPETAVLNGRKYGFYADFRNMLLIFTYWENPDLPDFVKWEIALALFYKKKVAPADTQAAMEYLAGFVTGFRPQKQAPAKLLDWQHDADLILADINKIAGGEVRALPFVHWWTFLSWFHGIGQGQLSAVVAIRDKLRRGHKLDSWEAEFYREHRQMICLPQRQSREEAEEKARLESLLSGERREYNGNENHAHAG